MNDFKKEYRKLYKYYKKELLHINNFNMTHILCNLDYFITYLRFIRDFLLLTDSDINPENNMKIASLCAAIAEYEQYSTCFSKFYTVVNNVPIKIDKAKTNEQVANEYNAARQLHWKLFCDLIQTHMEGWFTDDITI